MFNQGYSYRHEVSKFDDGLGLLDYLAKAFSHSSRGEWGDRIAAGEIVVNGQTANGTEELHRGMKIVWNRPGWVEQDTPQQYQKIYGDDSLLVVNKPSGLPTLPGAGFYQNTLLMMVKREFPDVRPLHRLGRATSGLVLFALDEFSASKLSQDWSQVKKRYRACSVGCAREDFYDIRTNIGLQDHPRLGKVYAADPLGKPARSLARVIQREKERTFFEVDLETGRPHQIRIHLASIGHPLEGDPLYGLDGKPIEDRPGLPGDGGYLLHAKSLSLIHPKSSELLELECELPEAWSR